MTTGRGQTIVSLDPGQFVFGRCAAAQALKMKPSTVAARLKRLEKLGNLNIQAGTHFSVVTVCNWASYQTPKKQNEQPTKQPSGNQLTTNCLPSSTYNKETNKTKKTKKMATAFVLDLGLIKWPQHLNTSSARKALGDWADYKQTTAHRWRSSQGPQALVNSFADYSCQQFVTQINLALAHGSCKAPWLPANTFGKTSESNRGGNVKTDPKVEREMRRSGRIKATREQIENAKTEAERLNLEKQLARHLAEASR